MDNVNKLYGTKWINDYTWMQSGLQFHSPLGFYIRIICPFGSINFHEIHMVPFPFFYNPLDSMCMCPSFVHSVPIGTHSSLSN
jgi:hypothetical protein